MSTRTHPTKRTYIVATLLTHDVSETGSRKSEQSAGFDLYGKVHPRTGHEAPERE